MMSFIATHLYGNQQMQRKGGAEEDEGNYNLNKGKRKQPIFVHQSSLFHDISLQKTVLFTPI